MRNILILGASYGSLLGTKLAMAGHNVTLLCRAQTAELINSEGTKVRLKLRDEETHREISSLDLPGKVDAATPEEVDPGSYDLVALAMQEPQYQAPPVKALMKRIAAAPYARPTRKPSARLRKRRMCCMWVFRPTSRLQPSMIPRITRCCASWRRILPP